MQSCPDFPYRLEQVRLYTSEEVLSPEQLAFRLATERFSADLLAGEWRVRFLDGAELEGEIEGAELAELSELVEGSVLRVAAEGPTMLATDFKAALRELVDRSVSARI